MSMYIFTWNADDILIDPGYRFTGTINVVAPNVDEALHIVKCEFGYYGGINRMAPYRAELQNPRLLSADVGRYKIEPAGIVNIH